jgi:DNA-binding CsgD family transcriptional regulator
VRLHHTGSALHTDLTDLVLARTAQRFPTLTPRDTDVLRGLLHGLDTPALAQRLGLTPASAQTYQKRLHAKLGVGGQRELLALLMEASPP